MAKIELYGLVNCDTIKKARKWLDAQGHEYTFHDYKKEGADPAKVEQWIATLGLDKVLNKRGTTYRKLSDAEKEDAADRHKSVALLVQHPSMIKRPIVERASPGGDATLVGFKEDEWSALLS